MRSSQILSIALLSTCTSAWFWSLDSIAENKALQGVEHLLFRRADSTTTDVSSAASTTQTSSATSSTDSSTASSTDSSATSSSTASTSSGASTTASGSPGTATSTDGSSTTSSGTTSANTTSTYGNTAGYGGATMITPNVYSSSSYYRIGEYVTFAWNYTSLSVTPTAIDILATCTANSATYTIAMNQSVTGSIGAVTWDTQSTGSVPLLTETYTLIIHDAQLDVSATPSYGHLSAYTQHAFAMYTPQAYTPLADGWTCVTCSGAMSSLERQTLGFVFAMAALTIATFTIFAGNFGVL